VGKFHALDCSCEANLKGNPEYSLGAS